MRTFAEVLQLPKTSVVRDAAIQRFEYTFEAVWKGAQLYLKTMEGLEPASPKTVIRGCRQVALLDDGQTQIGLRMADDRNLTAHTYNEALAEAIYSRLPGYLTLMDAWLRSMEGSAPVPSP